MNSFAKTVFSIFLITTAVILVSCNQTSESKIGTISLSVVDNDSIETPIADVEVTITPINITEKTNTEGKAIFEVAAGDYFVDAEVCCIGPGYIQYHKPITVIAQQTLDVKLIGCLRCQ